MDLREVIRQELLQARMFKPYSDGDKSYPYYVSNLNENIIGGKMSDNHRKMFEEGSGGELYDTPAKAKAIDSSSMLSYNFFRHVSAEYPIEIDGIKYVKVFFEVKLRTLDIRSNPANMDVVLIGGENDKTVLFIESKFLEYLKNGAADFSESYTRIDSYYNDNAEKNELLDISTNFYENKKTREQYNDGIKQNICHLIGISNLKNSVKAREWFSKTYKNKEVLKILYAKDFRFMNIIFHPKNEKASKIYCEYICLLKDFQEKLPDSIRKYANPTFIMNYRDLYDKLPNELISEKKELKTRYIDFHSDSSKE